MASTTFTDLSTVIVASWLNDINAAVYNLLGDGVTVATTKAGLRTSLGLTTSTTGSTLIVQGTTGQRDAVPVAGYLRFNTSLDQFEGFTTGTGWSAIGGSGVARTSATGSAVMPTGTTAQRDVSPVMGYLRYNSTLTAFEGYSGSVWSAIAGGGATGAGGDTVFVENSRIVTTSYTLSTGKSASMVGPVTVNTGITLTIPTGQRLVVL